MKASQYKAEKIMKNKEEHTKFTIGNKVKNSNIEKCVIALGGKLVKETKFTKQYELKGDYVHLCIVC